MKQYLTIVTLLLLTLIGCSPESNQDAGTLHVVATTNIIGDVVSVIGGEHIDLTILIEPGIDPHNFQPVPADVIAIQQADVIFVNGFGLEAFLDELLANAGSSGQVVPLSTGIEPRYLTEEDSDPDHDHGHDENDPHVWFDPTNVAIWADNIATTLSTLDETHATTYTSNAQAYQTQLTELDQWIKEQVALIPAHQRQLVTDHDELGYFAQRYGFQLVGAVIPAYSTAASPSAQALADLETAVKEINAPAIFVGTTVNDKVANQLAEDTGVQLVPIYTGSLSEADGSASTYLNFMRYNVTQITTALQ